MTTDRKTAPDAVDLLLLGLIATAWAARTLLAGLIALVFTMVGAPPKPAPLGGAAAPRPTEEAPVAPAPVPAAHPLVQLAAAAADQLQPLPVAQLRRLARAAGLPRALTHRGRRAELLEALGGLEVALA